LFHRLLLLCDPEMSLIIEDSYVQTLQAFGLSFVQAKTYFTLLKLQEGDIKTIAANVGVARQEIYRTMPSLEKLGLTQKIIGKPITYKVTPLRDALGILLERQQEKVADLQTKQDWMMTHFCFDNQGEKRSCEDDSQFMITSELTLFSSVHQKLFLKTEESIDISVPFISEKFLKYWVQLGDVIAKKKKLKVRVIAPENSKEVKMLPRKLLDAPNFQLKLAKDPFAFGLTIFDRKETTIAISEKGLPSLWSNNPSIVSLAKNNFDVLWKRAVALKDV
jgi:sugar-specific transcriptional regulator TrmB